MLKLKAKKRVQRLRRVQNSKPENLETLAEKHVHKIKKPSRLYNWYNLIDYSPTTSKIFLSLSIGTIIAAPFCQKGILPTIGGFAAGTYIGYTALSCPNNRRDYLN